MLYCMVLGADLEAIISRIVNKSLTSSFSSSDEDANTYRHLQYFQVQSCFVALPSKPRYQRQNKPRNQCPNHRYKKGKSKFDSTIQSSQVRRKKLKRPGRLL